MPIFAGRIKMSWLSCRALNEPCSAFEVFILSGLKCFIMQLVSSLISSSYSVGICCITICLPLMSSLVVDLGLVMWVKCRPLLNMDIAAGSTFFVYVKDRQK